MNGLTADKNLSSEELQELLLATTGHRADETFFAQPRLHPAIELQRHYDQAAPAEKARLKSALIAAVAEWRLRAHGLENLRFLAQAAAAIRSRATAPHFERILQRGGLLLRSKPPSEPQEHADIVSTIVATLSGFAPGERIGALLERLYFTPGLEPRLAGVLLQGLCRSRREHLPRYLERYLRLNEFAGEFDSVQHFKDPIFLRLFVESMTPAALVDLWPTLDIKARTFLLSSLGALEHTDSPDLFLAIEEEGATLHIEAAGRHETFELRSDSIDARFDDLHAAYGRIALPDLFPEGR